MRKQDYYEAKLERWRTITSMVRLFGSIIITFDACLKIFYYFKSRFTNHYVKDVYRAFLWVRPVSIIFIVIYNFCIEYIKLNSFTQKQDDYSELMQIRKDKNKKDKM